MEAYPVPNECLFVSRARLIARVPMQEPWGLVDVTPPVPAGASPLISAPSEVRLLSSFLDGLRNGRPMRRGLTENFVLLWVQPLAANQDRLSAESVGRLAPRTDLRGRG